MKEVLDWIAHFKGSEYTFTHGCCYWFAYLLHAQFGAEIWYAPIQGHFVGKINDTLYDIKGVFVPDDSDATRMMTWSHLQAMDPVWASHIERDCINFKESDEI